MQLSKLRPRLYPNGRLALELLYEDGEHWGVLTTDLVEAELAVDEVSLVLVDVQHAILCWTPRLGHLDDRILVER